MANNLKKFATEAAYTAATLNYPAVSWVTGTDTVHFDKSAAVNNKVKLAFTTDSCAVGKTFSVASDGGFIGNLNGITVNGEPLTPSGSDISLQLANNTEYLIEYDLKDDFTNVGYYFDINPAMGCSSELYTYDILFPAQVTNIGGLNASVGNIILEETTPPTLYSSLSGFGSGIYVPTESVNAYKSAEGWGDFMIQIYPISDYQGNIPV